MWCANCRADVAAAVSADQRRILCATCNAELEQPSTSSVHPATRDAEEILARWSNSGMFDPFGPLSTVTRRDGHGESDVPERTDASDASDAPDASDETPERLAVEDAEANFEDEEPTEEAVDVAVDGSGDAAVEEALTVDSDDAAEDVDLEKTPDPLETSAAPNADTFSVGASERHSPAMPAADEITESTDADREAVAAIPTSGSGKFRLDGPHRRKSSPTSSGSQDEVPESGATTRDAGTSDSDTLHPDPPDGNAYGALPSNSAAGIGAGGANPTVAEKRRYAKSHSPTARGPHFDVREQVRLRQSQQTNWVAVISQFLSYCGVGGLTVGTVCVIWGYFGGIASYLPVGWLVLTFGQMLLFLGMITLVSSGIENSSAELTRRLDGLRDRLNEIERERESEPRANAA